MNLYCFNCRDRVNPDCSRPSLGDRLGSVAHEVAATALAGLFAAGRARSGEAFVDPRVLGLQAARHENAAAVTACVELHQRPPTQEYIPDEAGAS